MYITGRDLENQIALYECLNRLVQPLTYQCGNKDKSCRSWEENVNEIKGVRLMMYSSESNALIVAMIFFNYSNSIIYFILYIFDYESNYKNLKYNYMMQIKI